MPGFRLSSEILELGYEKMVNILTCCSWPNNWGIREACPKICRKKRGELWGDQGWGWGWLFRLELVAGWSNLCPRLAEAQVLGGLTWLPSGIGGSLFQGICNVLFTHLSLGLAPGTMGTLSAASYLGRQHPQICSLGTEPRAFSSLVRACTVQCLVGQALSDRNQGCRDTASAGKSLTLAQVAQASGGKGLGFRESWARTELGLVRG